MKKTLKIVAPILFAVAGISLLLEAGLVSTPANNTLADRLSATTQRLETSLEQGTLPSVQYLEQLRLRHQALIQAKNEFGFLEPEPENQTLKAILTEWGYLPGDPISFSLETFQSRLLLKLGPDRKEEVRVFINDMARKMGQADLFSSLTLDITENLASVRPDPPKSLRPLRIVFSFVSGVGEAVDFIETWALLKPSGIVLAPELISIKRIDPDIWGASLRYYSGPPIRTDLSFLILFNAGNS